MPEDRAEIFHDGQTHLPGSLPGAAIATPGNAVRSIDCESGSGVRDGREQWSKMWPDFPARAPSFPD